MGNATNKPTGDTKSPTTSGTKIGAWKVVVPIVIGLGVVVLLFLHDAKTENLAKVWSGISFTPTVIGCICLGFLFMFGRDFGLTWRFRALTDHKLTWRQAYKVDFLCEFTNCITPSAVGGSSMGMFFLNSQGIEIGRATTLMLTTLVMDELFFVVACPIVVLLTPASEIFSSGSGAFSHGIRWTFWSVYFVLMLWTAILIFGILIKPQWIKSLLQKITGIKWLRKFQPQAESFGENMIMAAADLKGRKFRFWLEVFGATALSWTSRYLVVNALFMGFLPGDNHWQWVILARQFVIWVVLMVSPTPGGAGLSEWLFSEYYGDIVPTAGLALILAVFWRIISYYIYLVIGALIVPEWLKNAIGHHHSEKEIN